MPQQLIASYSESGRKSNDPELLLRILAIGYRYTISSDERINKTKVWVGYRGSIDASLLTQSGAAEVPSGTGSSKNWNG